VFEVKQGKFWHSPGQVIFGSGGKSTNERPHMQISAAGT
jgi:hypothetical protein